MRDREGFRGCIYKAYVRFSSSHRSPSRCEQSSARPREGFRASSATPREGFAARGRGEGRFSSRPATAREGFAAPGRGEGRFSSRPAAAREGFRAAGPDTGKVFERRHPEGRFRAWGKVFGETCQNLPRSLISTLHGSQRHAHEIVDPDVCAARRDGVSSSF